MEFRYKYVCRENEPWDSSELVKKENRQLERIGVKVSGIKCACVKESGLPVYFINGLVVEILQKGNAQTIKILEMMGYKRYMRLLDTREGKRQYVISLHRQIPLRKWLIYQKPTGGLYAFEYLTTEEDISPYPYITADRLPVMINSYGGYSTFDEATDGKNLLYCLVIPKGERPLSREDMFPCNSDKFVYGWISPAGDTYLCDYEEHMDAAEMIYEEQYKKLCMNTERELEKLGWIKVSRPTSVDREFGADGRIAYFTGFENRPTKAQLDKLVKENLHKTGNMGYYFEED